MKIFDPTFHKNVALDLLLNFIAWKKLYTQPILDRPGRVTGNKQFFLDGLIKAWTIKNSCIQKDLISMINSDILILNKKWLTVCRSQSAIYIPKLKRPKSLNGRLMGIMNILILMVFFFVFIVLNSY